MEVDTLTGHPQTCAYPDVCLGIAHVSGKVPLSGQRVWQIHNVSTPFRRRNGQIHCVSARPFVPREGLYQIHGQSLNTHRGKLGVPNLISPDRCDRVFFWEAGGGM